MQEDDEMRQLFEKYFAAFDFKQALEDLCERLDSPFIRIRFHEPKVKEVLLLGTGD